MTAMDYAQFKSIIILDACRYDAFLSRYSLYPRLKDHKLRWVEVDSVYTPGFYKRYMSHPVWRGYTFVSGHPGLNSLTSWDGYAASDHFRKVIDVWKEGWMEKFKTCSPESVMVAALEVRGPLVVHFVQPHTPHPTLVGFQASVEDNDPLVVDKLQMEAARRGEISPGEMKKAYLDSLMWVLGVVNIMVQYLPRPILITADHGELLGEGGRFGHRIDDPCVHEVPWLEVR